MAWTTPKQNWAALDGVSAADMNRIEANTAYLKTNNDAVPGKVNRGGDTMTGLLRFTIGSRTDAPIDIRPGDSSGNALLVTAGGATVVGGGAFPQNYYGSGAIPATTKDLVLGADAQIRLVTRYGAAPGISILFEDSNFRPQTNNQVNLGTASYRFYNVYGSNFFGVLKRFTGYLDPGAWAGGAAPYTQNISVSGIVAADYPIVSLVPSGGTADVQNQQTQFSQAGLRVVSSNNLLQFSAYGTRPTVGLTFQALVVR